MWDPDSFGWIMASNGLDTASPSILRFCVMPSDFIRDHYPWRIHIRWVMRDCGAGGLPTSKEQARLEEFENLITRAMLPDNHAVLTLTRTDSGVRSLVFYAKDVEQFMLRLQNMPHPHGRYPIVLDQWDDPDWSFYTAKQVELGQA